MVISVLLSLYAKEKVEYFNLAMKSIWDDQIRKPDEIILVLDGPLPDELNKAIDNWREKIFPSLVIVPLKVNQGLAIALNEGIKRCRGDYIARMDTDDISLPDRFLLQEMFLNEHPEVVLLGGGMIEFNEETGDLPARIMPQSKSEIKSAFCKTVPFVHPSVFIKRSLFDNGFLYNPKCRRCQDSELWFRIIAAGYEVANLPNIIIKYRKSKDLYERTHKSSATELKVFIHGISLLYGRVTWRYIYPIIHYLYHQLPPSLSNWIYKNFIIKYWRNKN